MIPRKDKPTRFSNTIRIGGLGTLNAAYVNQDSWKSANKGMRIQDTTEIGADAVLLRFYKEATTPLQRTLRGPWWFQGKEVRKMLQSARSSGEQVPDVVRSNAGLSRAWKDSGANFVVSVRLRTALTVYWGDPRPVGYTLYQDEEENGRVTVTRKPSGLEESGDTIGWMPIVPDPRCTQFFIPGTWEPRLVDKMFEVVATQSLAGNPQLEAGDIESFLRKARGE